MAKNRDSRIVLLFGGIVMAIAFLGYVFVPATTIPLFDFEVLGAIAITMILVGGVMSD